MVGVGKSPSQPLEHRSRAPDLPAFTACWVRQPMDTVSCSSHSLDSNHRGHVVSAVTSPGPQNGLSPQCLENVGQGEPCNAYSSRSVSRVGTSTLTSVPRHGHSFPVSGTWRTLSIFPSPSILPTVPTPITNSHRGTCSSQAF